MANENNQNQQQNSTSELVVRREKLAGLVEAGNNPFEITKFDVTHESIYAIREVIHYETFPAARPSTGGRCQRANCRSCPWRDQELQI